MATDGLSELMQAATVNEELMTSLKRAKTPDELVRIAGEQGIVLQLADANVDDELTDADLESVAGGTMLHPTMSVFCGTDGSFCTFNPYACSQG